MYRVDKLFAYKKMLITTTPKVFFTHGLFDTIFIYNEQSNEANTRNVLSIGLIGEDTLILLEIIQNTS